MSAFGSSDIEREFAKRHPFVVAGLAVLLAAMGLTALLPSSIPEPTTTTPTTRMKGHHR